MCWSVFKCNLLFLGLPAATKHVPDVEIQTESNLQSFDNIFKTTYNLPHTNNNYLIENSNLPNIVLPVEDKAKYAAVVETDLGSEFEMANGLKNYATINTAEPIQTQMPYNIGTENIEDGKDGETLNDTQMELEDGSLITEIENAGINLYDLASQSTSSGFDVDMFNEVFPTEDKKKVNIISVKRILPEANLANKQPEATQMFANNEVPSTWIDAIMYHNASQLNVFGQSTLDDRDSLPNTMEMFTLQDAPVYSFTPEQSTNTDANLLKVLTADADICKCVDCKCDSINNCQNCDGNDKVLNIEKRNSCQTNSIKTGSCQPGSDKGDCCQTGSTKGSCCKDGDKTDKMLTCGTNKNDCCVVVCLKTLDQLRQVLNMAANCGGLQNLMLGCIKGGEFCAVQK